MLLTGLYQPVSGRILLDGEPVTDRNGYLGLFSAIFTDYHLFQHLLGPEPKEALVAEWLERLQMGSKLAIEDGFIADIDPPRPAQAGRPAAGPGRAAGGDAV